MLLLVTIYKQLIELYLVDGETKGRMLSDGAILLLAINVLALVKILYYSKSPYVTL
jgi:hypothetical protein